MKPITFSDAPGWEFNVEEVSANVFTVTARDTHGRSIEKTGIDLDELIAECHQEALDMISMAIAKCHYINCVTRNRTHRELAFRPWHHSR